MLKSNEKFTTDYSYQRFHITLFYIFVILDSNVFNNHQTLVLNNDLKSYLIPPTRQLIKQNTQWQLDLQLEKQNVRETIMNGTEVDESNESSAVNTSNVTIVRSDSLMDINNYNIENEMGNIQSIVITTAPAITRQQVIQKFTLNKDQRQAFIIIACHLDASRFLKQGKINQFSHHLCYYFLCRRRARTTYYVCTRFRWY